MDKQVEQAFKPEVQLTGTNGNVFALLATYSKVLKAAGQREAAKEMQSRVLKAGSYEEALGIMGEYVEVS